MNESPGSWDAGGVVGGEFGIDGIMIWTSRFDRPLNGFASLSPSGEGDIDLDDGSPSSDRYCKRKGEAFCLPCVLPRFSTTDMLSTSELASDWLDCSGEDLEEYSVRMVRDTKVSSEQNRLPESAILLISRGTDLTDGEDVDGDVAMDDS